MKKSERFVITINRELGSGGRTIGHKLAERLGVDFYDKDLIKALEDKYHLTSEEIELLKGRSHGWWADFKRVVSLGEKMRSLQAQYYQTQVGQMPDLLTTDEIFQTEVEILRGIAENESCIIAGRCSFFVFKNHPNHVNIFIQAPLKHRIARLVRKRGISDQEAEKIIRSVDAMRENYVQNYTKTSRYNSRNYDLVLNMEHLNEDQAVDIIIKFIGQ